MELEDSDTIKIIDSELHPPKVYTIETPLKTSADVNVPPANTWYLYLLTFLAATGGFLFGYDTGVVSGAMLLIRRQFVLTTIWQEAIVSITIATAAIFALIGGYLNDRLGRKPVILLGSLTFLLGSVFLAAASNKIMLLIGRIIVGMGVGFASVTVPVYLAECAPSASRGRIVVVYQLSITVGLLVATLIDGAFSYDEVSGWRYMLGLAALPAAIQLVGFAFMPETPRYLVSRDNLARAKQVLVKLRATLQIEEELDAIKASNDEYQKAVDSKRSCCMLVELLKDPSVRRALFVGCGLSLFQQITGINTVMYYGATIIKMAGVRLASTAIWMSAAVSSVNVLFSFLGLYLVEKIGRRPLTLGSLIGVFLTLILIAVGFQLGLTPSPSIDMKENVNSSLCETKSSCFDCVKDRRCGFCFVDAPHSVSQNASCLAANPSSPDHSIQGRCSGENLPEPLTWAYDYCPTRYSWLIILGLVLYLASFATGLGPMPWTINSEIYPLWARSTGMGAATATNWIMNLIISMTFLTLSENMNVFGAFYLYAGFGFLGILFVYFLLPETKGKTLEEMNTLFEHPLYSSQR